MRQDRTKVTIDDQWNVACVSICDFDWCQNQWPWMTLKGHYAFCFKTRVSWCCYLYIFSSTFSLLLVDKCLPDVAGAITALTFRKLKQITIKESLGVALHRAVSLRQHGFLVGTGDQVCTSVITTAAVRDRRGLTTSSVEATRRLWVNVDIEAGAFTTAITLKTCPLSVNHLTTVSSLCTQPTTNCLSEPVV